MYVFLIYCSYVYRAIVCHSVHSPVAVNLSRVEAGDLRVPPVEAEYALPDGVRQPQATHGAAGGLEDVLADGEAADVAALQIGKEDIPYML